MTAAAKLARWGEDHRREALRRTYEIAAENASLHGAHAAMPDGHTAWFETVREDVWRRALDQYVAPARVNREVRRVRGLAEGRLVRKTTWRVDMRNCLTLLGGYGTSKEAHDEVRARRGGRFVVRVTRIRRAA